MITWPVNFLEGVKAESVWSVYLINKQHSWDKFSHSLIYVFINHLKKDTHKQKKTSNINKYIIKKELDH